MWMFRVPYHPTAVITPKEDFPVDAYTFSLDFYLYVLSMDGT